MMHWTTAVPLGLGLLHLAVAHDEASVLHAARLAALAVAMETMSNCDLHGVSLLLAAPTLLAGSMGMGFELLHAATAQRTEQERAAARAKWEALQRERAADDAFKLLACRRQLLMKE